MGQMEVRGERKAFTVCGCIFFWFLKQVNMLIIFKNKSDF